MIGVDTNVLVRYFTKDSEPQFRRAETFIDQLTPDNSGFISLVVLAELYWVMRSRYRLSKLQLIEMLAMLLNMQGFVLESAETVEKALFVYSKTGADFADCLIERSAARAGCAYTITFDEQAAKFAGMRMVP